MPGPISILVMLMLSIVEQPSAVPPIGRVRDNGDRSIAMLLREGSDLSPTFRRLVETIDRSDGLVYVESGRCGHHVRACLAMTVRRAGPHRVLRILVDTHRDHEELVAAIGHELQHAVEVLSDPHVIDDVTIYNFFMHIAPSDKSHLETEEALQVFLDVLAELRTRRR